MWVLVVLPSTDLIDVVEAEDKVTIGGGAVVEL